MTYVCGDKHACASRDDSDEQDNDLVCEVEDFSGVVWGQLEDSIYLEYNFVTSPMFLYSRFDVTL
jgi:hypothetical protein